MLTNRIREHRERLGFSQKDVARLVGSSMTHQTVSKLESGTIQLKARYIGLLAEALGVSAADLWGDDEPLVISSPVVDDEEGAAARKLKLLSFWGSLTPEQQENFLLLADFWARSIIPQ